MSIWEQFWAFILSFFTPATILGLLLSLLGLTGCSESDMPIEQQLRVADKLIEYGERHGVAYCVTVEGTGKIGAEWDVFIGANLGLGVRGAYFGNTLASRLSPSPVPFLPNETADAVTEETGEPPPMVDVTAVSPAEGVPISSAPESEEPGAVLEARGLLLLAAPTRVM